MFTPPATCSKETIPFDEAYLGGGLGPKISVQGLLSGRTHRIVKTMVCKKGYYEKPGILGKQRLENKKPRADGSKTSANVDKDLTRRKTDTALREGLGGVARTGSSGERKGGTNE